jgi:hypothetical protein
MARITCDTDPPREANHYADAGKKPWIARRFVSTDVAFSEAKRMRRQTMQPQVTGNAWHAAACRLTERSGGLNEANQFVFLDGCSTGSGTFSESFGIPAQTLSTNNFAAQGVESRAFLGFTSDKTFNVSTWQEYSEMIGGFYEDWLSNALTMQNCVYNAQNGVHDADVVTMDSSAVIFGAEDMVHNTSTRP